jgi:hypothetical protein
VSACPASIDLLTSVTFSSPSAELPKKGVLHTRKLRVEFLGQDSDVVGDELNSQIVVNLPVTDVSMCTGCNGKTLGLKKLLLSDMSETSNPPEGHAKSVIGRMNCLHSRTPFLVHRPLLFIVTPCINDIKHFTVQLMHTTLKTYSY